jgi:hypothetical protein
MTGPGEISSTLQQIFVDHFNCFLCEQGQRPAFFMP